MRSCLVALALLAACGDNLPGADARPEGHLELQLDGLPGKPRVLVYTYENLWRHASNLDCRSTIVTMNSSRGYTVLTSNDPLAITAANLALVDVIAFCVTSGDGLDALGRADLEAWIRAGGGVVGFHSASMTETSWPFYIGGVVGTQFAGHVPGLFDATLHIPPSTHPITAGLSDLTLNEEWYFFTHRPEAVPGTEILMTLDETTLPADYPAMNKQGYHAIGWANENEGGRSFYTAIGHNPATFADPTVIELMARAIEWAAHQR